MNHGGPTTQLHSRRQWMWNHLSRFSLSSSFQYLQSIKNNGKPKYLQKVCFDFYEQIDNRELYEDAIQADNLKTSKHYDDVRSK